MERPMSTQEQQLCSLLVTLPSRYNYVYSRQAQRELLDGLFWTLARGNADNLSLFFPRGTDPSMRLSDAQGAVEGAEYTEAARGKRCGHIFKAGEASYACRTCSTDDTCVLCSRCFEATDHTGHMIRINISVGNSGCCDCGDPEAWKLPMHCTIHSELEGSSTTDKGKATSNVPEEVKQAISMTVARVIDFICDVISCSPEQLRQAKSRESITKDELASRLSEESYGVSEPLPNDGKISYSLLLWNDEKHTITDVQNHVARSCRTTEAAAYRMAIETDSIGRSILKHDPDIDKLLAMAKKLEEIRVTVTVRASRDTFREQMCATIIDWLSDIAGCSVGNDNTLLRQIVCQELLAPWRQGSSASHSAIGKDGIDDEALIAFEMEREQRFQRHVIHNFQRLAAQQAARIQVTRNQDPDNPWAPDENVGVDSDDDIDGLLDFDDEGSVSVQEEEDEADDDVMMVDAAGEDAAEPGSEWRQNDQAPLEDDEATMAGYPPPPPPPTTGEAARRAVGREREQTPSDSDTTELVTAPAIYGAKANADIPKTPGKAVKPAGSKPGRYWLEAPAGYLARDYNEPAEDVFQRVRLDWLILFDLRLWKKVRNDLRSLYISTVVQVPEFKRILGLRFASLYTILAQLYLIGDREPDHSIINLSLQMFTTPSITAGLVERGNFLTSLLSILYTFLTTRQVGHPWDVSSDAVLAFDSGSVTNRRMYHFYMDLKFLFCSPHVQERIRAEARYLMQFLDLVKLHQGIGPNVRAVGEHVEYETDSWITASLVTREINRMSRQLSDAFRNCPEEERPCLSRAIRTVAKTVIINSIGAERGRFKHAEIKDEVKFKTLQDMEFDTEVPFYKVVKFVVETDHISFHHALHYTLSWLIECGKSYTAQDMRALLSFTTQELWAKPRCMGKKTKSKYEYSAEDYLMAAFDYPLRVCAWLAQIKANMWVRNGISLRHQAATYRGVNQRDVSHHRDIFLLQTAMVVCNPSRVLASIIDRFGMENWVKGIFEQKSESQDDAQHLDVVEDMLHLLIVLLSDRTSLIPPEDEPNQTLLSIRRDLVHVLCFKPLSFNEITNKLPDRYQEQEDFHQVLESMTTFKAPEGVSDVGTFELRTEFVEEVDPYIAHYNKNQREEAETTYRKRIAKKTGRDVDEVVYEPRLRPIPSGLFKDLAGFTGTGMFAQIIYYSLLYPLLAAKLTPAVPGTRIETFLQVVLHLILIAIAEDNVSKDGMTDEPLQSFIHIALSRQARSNFIPEAPNAKTIVALLDLLSTKEEFKACHKKILLILNKMRHKCPYSFDAAYAMHGIPLDRINTASPAAQSAEAERERKKKAALSRQAKVMEQFQQQQKSFMENQGDIDWGADLEDDEEVAEPVEDRKNFWKYPSGTCILCQEDTDDRRLYGTFALLTESRILRLTDFRDPDFVREAYNTPCNLDRSAEDIRPFGVAHENRKVVEKVNQSGEKILEERQTIGKGFPASLSIPGPVSVGCGHMMHFSCFETYYDATQRRQAAQIARHHPENLRRNEFVCPLCKALGNAFLPVIWKGKEEAYPGALQPSESFVMFLERELRSVDAQGLRMTQEDSERIQSRFTNYAASTMMGDFSDKAPDLVSEAWRRNTGPVQTLTIGTGLGSQTIPIHESNIRENPSVNHGGIIGELVKVYQRLRDTLTVNNLNINLEHENSILNAPQPSKTLVNAVGMTICAVEIQQRGVDAEYGMTLLDKIPEQVLTHLRILAETVESYIAFGGLRSRSDSGSNREFRASCERQHFQLFGAQYYADEGKSLSVLELATSFTPLLSQDVFLFMNESTFHLARLMGIDPSNLLLLCYLAELVKVVHYMGMHIPIDVWVDKLVHRETSDRSLNTFAEFALRVTETCMDLSGNISADTYARIYGDKDGKHEVFNQPGLKTLEGFYSFAKKYALVFLRKAVILFYVKHGIDVNCAVANKPEADELDRLTEVLRVPSFDEICASLTDVSASFGWPDAIKTMVSGWIRHQIDWMAKSTERSPSLPPESAALTHPGIFELVGLPKNYDTLIEESTKRRCPTTGKDLSDPMMCLLCGEIFCSQSVCCLKQDRLPGEVERESIGGAQQHMRK
ncbi:hypothetical protein jhhlp_002413 [Lomentospora prolificans]|uniref:E3 ubiquitin-protein ligase n=1 Tax=Lomentospora prolificans TaxID=41688 RepID=A0A2N3NE02_9PEZI|nr:hypothetical protein jhhlp_002413 [Lomentospora prolificans]